MHETIDDSVALCFKCFEQAIKHNEYTTIVLVNVLCISSMMHTMMTRSIEHILNDTRESNNDTSMDPVLIQQTNLTLNGIQFWTDSQ
ncbi:hypothetical protein D3C80_1889390 [compost metagenome]